MSRIYRFLNVANSGGYGNVFTDKGTEYIGFQARDDGKLVFLRKGYKNVDDADRGQLSTFGDVLTKEQAGKLKFYAQNPNTEPDPIKSESLADLADSRDGYDAQGNLIKTRYHRPYRAVEYEGLRNFLDVGKNNRTESRTTPSPQGTGSVCGFRPKNLSLLASSLVLTSAIVLN